MNYVKNQLTVMRGNLLKEIDGIKPEFMDVQPEGFNNTIHWHLGHVLTAAEKFYWTPIVNCQRITANYSDMVQNQRTGLGTYLPLKY